ncbi:MAG: superoxide dismutase [Flavobacteriales bacterium]
MDRKQFLSRSLKASLGAIVAGPALANMAACNTPAEAENTTPPDPASPPTPALQLAQIALPYAYDALEPMIDKQTMEIHYTKHHAAYVKNANAAIAEEGVKAPDEAALLAGISAYSTKLRNNAGGVWNHNFFWQVMGPGSKSAEGSKVLDALNGAFGSFDKFKEVFTDAAMKRFGSGWAWLVQKDGKLEVGSTPNQDCPLMDVCEFKGRPLLGLDVWEHAYYLHYQNKRNEYVAAWWNTVDWNALAARLG